MSEKNLNNLCIAGILTSMEEEYSIETKHGKETFYRLMVETPRLSETVDRLPIIASERLLFRLNLEIGMYVGISGEIRTNRRHKNDNNRPTVFGFAKDVLILSKEDYDYITDKDTFEAEGYITRTPRYRETVTGRIITDLIVAVNDVPHGKNKDGRSSYIPCIAWGTNAKMAKKLNVGDKIYFSGRFQSRNYRKRDGENYVDRVSYEVSIADMRIINDDANQAMEKEIA